MKKNIKLFVTFLLFVIFTCNFYNYSMAADIEPGCSVSEKAYEPGLKFWDLNILRTVNNLLIGFVINLYTHVSGVDPDTTMKCQGYINDRMAQLRHTSSGWIPDEYGQCRVSPDEATQVNSMCEALASEVGIANWDYETSGKNSILVDAVNSSMIGIGNALEVSARKEPLPVSLAYYWDQSVTKIPFAGRALAAGGDAYENLPVIKAVYNIWDFSLKVSLGLLSVVLMYTGIMITMGKKISNQLVVSVQYAIPKIVIGAILIIFSYPVGAIITSISFGLFRGAFPIVFGVLLGNADTPSGMVLLGLSIQTLSIARGGIAYLVVAIVILILLLVAKWIIYLKVLLVYMKMALSIVTAPFEFVLGTIPGNDGKIKDWFLRMFKYGLTLFGMGLVIPLTLWISLEVMSAYIGGGSSEVGGWGQAISLIAPILITIFGFGVGIGMEKRVDEMLGTGKKKR